MAQNSNPERWAVVGGGLLGLSLARRLRQAGHSVTVYEAADTLGGLASAWQIGDVVWDRHYHVTLLSDTHLRGLIRDLGLESETEFVTTRTGVYAGGKLYSVSNSWEFLTFPPLRLLDKLRLGLTIFYASKIRDGRRLEQIPVADWLRRWSGRRAFEELWLPLLRSKLGENYKVASASFIWAIIARMYAARRTGLKREMFGYVRGGYARILDRLTSALTDSGVEIRLQAPVRRVDSGRIERADGSIDEHENIVVTAAAPLASRLCPDLTTAEHQQLNGVTYQGIVCASLLLKKPLANFYVTNITDDWVPFTAVIEMTALVIPAQFGGRHLVYLPKYVTPDDPIFDLPDSEIEERFVSALARMYSDFKREDLVAFRVSRVRHVLAVATMGYSDHLPPVKTSLPGVYLVNSAHIVNGTLNVNETLQLAERAFDAIVTTETPDHRPAEVTR